MKILLKDKIIIESFDYIPEGYAEKIGCENILYCGLVSDISDELAEELADKGELCEYYWNNDVQDYDKTLTAKNSIIISAKGLPCCLIYEID